MTLFIKQKQIHRDRKQTYGYLRGSGGGINREYGITQIHTTICKIDNKDSGCSTENYIQYLIINYNGKEPKKEYRCVYMCKWNKHNIVNQLYFNLKKKCLQREGVLNINTSMNRMLLNSLT